MCVEYSQKNNITDGVVDYFMKLMDKHKNQAPDEYEGVYNVDQKPQPPEMEFDHNMGGPEEDDSEHSAN